MNLPVPMKDPAGVPVPNGAPEVSGGDVGAAPQQGRRGRRSAERSDKRSGGGSSRSGSSRRTVPAGVAMGHSLLLALSASMVVIGSTGVLEWRDDDFLNLVIGASFLMGMQVMYLVQKYLRWRQKQRDRRTLKAVG
jgi:hypothetical protein